jgi:hypothetical protein
MLLLLLLLTGPAHCPLAAAHPQEPQDRLRVVVRMGARAGPAVWWCACRRLVQGVCGHPEGSGLCGLQPLVSRRLE